VTSNWEYFVHVSRDWNILNILRTGKIKSGGSWYGNAPKTRSKTNRNVSKTRKTIRFNAMGHGYKYPKMVYCQYIYRDLPINPKNKYWNHDMNMGSPLIIIDPIIAKEKEMWVSKSISFGAGVIYPEYRIMHTDGNLDAIPDMTPLKTYIENEIALHPRKRSVYAFSHEVMFNEIPIRYIKAILYNGSLKDDSVKQVIKHIKNHNLPIHIGKFKRKPASLDEIYGKEIIQ
jgi:hypothetical protein